MATTLCPVWRFYFAGTLEISRQLYGNTRSKWLVFWQRTTLHVPVCPTCHPVLRRQLRVQQVVFWSTVTVGGATVLSSVRRHDTHTATMWKGLGTALAFFAPYGLWSSIWPPAFDFSPDTQRNVVRYWFVDPRYAREFASLNGAQAQA